MTHPNPLKEKDVVLEGVREIGKTLRSIVSKLSGQYVLLFGIAVMLIAIAGLYIATLNPSVYEIRAFPYALLAFGVVIIILWLIGNLVNKNAINSHITKSSNEKFGSSLHKRLRYLDKITDGSDADELIKASDDLVKFIKNLPHGEYYAEEIKKITRFTEGILSFNYVTGKGLDEYHENLKRSHREYKQQLLESRRQIYTLVDEFLKIQ
jgi:hypothetical protein